MCIWSRKYIYFVQIRTPANHIQTSLFHDSQITLKWIVYQYKFILYFLDESFQQSQHLLYWEIFCSGCVIFSISLLNPCKRSRASPFTLNNHASIFVISKAEQPLFLNTRRVSLSLCELRIINKTKQREYRWPNEHTNIY